MNSSLSSTALQLHNNELRFGETAVLKSLPQTVSARADALEAGVFLSLSNVAAAERGIYSLGEFGAISRFTACYRFMPYWMKPAAGSRGGEVPVETQFLLAELPDEQYALFVPLLDGAFRATLQGRDENGLDLVAESGDPAVTTDTVCGLFVAVSADPYALMENGARSVMAHMKTGRLRREKTLPDFVDQFGWCTWDAFYRDVSQEKVRIGLESFAAGGVVPKMLILDDGWQSVRDVGDNDLRLTSFAANEKFGGDLRPTVEMAKTEFGLDTFFVWHAMTGYYGGVDLEAMPEYGTHAAARLSSPGILHHIADFDQQSAATMGLVAPEQIYRFFHNYHEALRLQGVDGVKVDVQAPVESVGAGLGGRVQLMRHYHDALEGSVHTHFLGNLINCMSSSTDMLYSALSTTVTRTSDDFFPQRPLSHGLHLYANAFVSLWFGEFVHPDWDMFQSGHELGAFHAAGRALSGGPVYVSDKPGAHNFDLLRKLVLPDGTILRAHHVGRPTRDCLFLDPTKDDGLLKIFNLNLDAGILGAFNTRYEAEGSAPVAGAVSPRDVEGLGGERFAVFAHQCGELRVLARAENWNIALPQLAHELFAIVPIDNGVAPIGLADMFNSAGAIVRKGWSESGLYEVQLKAGGRFLAWCETPPTRAVFEGEECDFAYEANRLEVALASAGKLLLHFS